MWHSPQLQLKVSIKGGLALGQFPFAQTDKKGIGATLIEDGLQRLTAAKAKGCVVLGDPNYYARFGFEADSELFLDGVPAEYLMRRTFEGLCRADELPITKVLTLNNTVQQTTASSAQQTWWFTYTKSMI